MEQMAMGAADHKVSGYLKMKSWRETLKENGEDNNEQTGR
jgi:hypothetical protein